MDINERTPDQEEMLNDILGDRWDECLQNILDELCDFELCRVRESDPKNSVLEDVAAIVRDPGRDDAARVADIARLLAGNGYDLGEQ